MQKLQVNYESVNRIIPYERNARVHDAAQIDQIIASINEFGFTNPILIDANNVVVAGHGRLEAAKRLGMDMVPTIKLGHLTDAQRRAYTIADNQIALNSSWDVEMLQLELGELQKLNSDINLIGFSKIEFEKIMLDEPSNENKNNKNGATELDQNDFEKFDHTCPKCGFEFDEK